MKNKILVYILTVFLVTAMVSSLVIATTDLDVAPTSSLVSNNDEFLINVDIDTDDSVSGGQFVVNFDPAVLQALSQVDGGFLSQDGVAVFDGGSSIDNTNGKVTFNMMAGTPNKGFNGTGHLVNITFEAVKKNDNSDITIDNIILGDFSGSAVSVSSIDNGTVAVATVEKMLINEFLADPTTGNDWVELYNNDTKSINLSNWQVNDTAGNKEIIADVVLAPGERTLVDMGSSLNKGGDTIYLINDEGLIIAQETYATEIGEDKSYGRMHDGMGTWVTFDEPTPDAANNRLSVDSIADKNINEEHSRYFDVSLDISDPDGDPLVFTVVDEDATKVDCSILNDTNVTLVPVVDWYGTTNCTIRVNDTYGTVDKLFNIVVANVNDAPTIAGVPDINPTEDVDYELNITPYIGDIDNDVSALVITENSTHATVNGQIITFNYPNGILGEEVMIIVSDGSLTDEQAISVAVGAVNDAPTIAGVPDISPTEDVDFELDVSPYIGDVDNDVSTLIITENSSYATVDGQIITFNYPNGILGEEVMITVSDGSLSSDQTITVSVIPVNDAPVIDPSIASLSFLEGQYLVLNLSDYVSDVDNADEDITWSAAPTVNLDVDIDNELMNISTVSPTLYGREVFTMTADDGGATDDIEVTVDIQSILDFSNLVVTIDGTEHNAGNGDTVGPASPGSTLSFSIDLTNNYPLVEEWVEGIVLRGKIDSTIDDETTISPSFTLDGTKTATKELVFNDLPLTVEEGSYNLTIDAWGMDHMGMPRGVSWLVYIDYVTLSREIRITEAAFSDDELGCFRETELDITLKNTGETFQNVNLEVENLDLGIMETRDFPMNAKETINKTFNDSLKWPLGVTLGTYPFDIRVKYDDGQGGYLTQSTSVDLTFVDCFDIEDQSIEEDSTTPLVLDLGDYVDDPVKADSDFTYAIEDETDTALIDCELVAMTLTCANPTPDQSGYSDIQVSVSSGAHVNYDTFRLTVEEDNDGPVIIPTIPNVFFDEGQTDSTIDLDDYVEDMDNADDELTWTYYGNVNITVDINSLHIVTFGTLDEDYYGIETITFNVSDGEYHYAQDVVVTVNQLQDDWPEITNPTLLTAGTVYGDGEDVLLEIEVLNPDSMVYTAEWYVDGTNVGSGLTYTFNEAVSGNYDVEVILEDIGGTQEYDSADWEIEVSSVPVTSYSGTINDVDDTNVGGFSGLTISNGNVMIDFGNAVINLEDVVDLDSFVTLDEGVVAVDTDEPGYDVFKIPATITMYGLEHESTPPIYYDNGFTATGTTECTSTTDPSCTNIVYNATTGTLSFDVSHFTVFFLPIPNKSPRITSSPSTTAVIDEGYSYAITATDEDGDSLDYSLLSGPSGMSISSNILTWTPTTNLTNESVTISVTDNVNAPVTQSWTIDVVEGAKLIISDLDIKVGSDKDKDLNDGDRIGEEAKPGDKVEFDIELENLYSRSSDIKIEDIEVTVTIKDIDDGDDIEDDVTLDDIDAGKDDSVKLDFWVPTLVDEGDYDVIIEVDAEDEDGNDQDIRWELILEVNKDSHELLLDRVDLTPSLVRCNRNPSVDVRVVNIGSKDEDDVSIEIRSDLLDIEMNDQGIELEEGDTDDSEYDSIYRLRISEDTKTGVYPISVKAYYDGRLGDQKTVDLTVEDCADLVVPVKQEPVEVITTSEPTKIRPVQTPVTEITFRNTSEYITLLVVLFIILLGAVIFLFMAMAMMLGGK